jgi:hypothetical protein
MSEQSIEPPRDITDYVTSGTPVGLSEIQPGNVYQLKSKSGVDLNEKAFIDIAVKQYNENFRTMVGTEYDTLRFTGFLLRALSRN